MGENTYNLSMNIRISDFLAIRKAKINSKNNLTVLVAPNKAGKTHLLLLIYSIFWSLWKTSKEDKFDDLNDTFSLKVKNTFLIKDLDELVSWEGNGYKVEFNSGLNDEIKLFISGPPFNASFDINSNIKASIKNWLDKSPIYIQPAGMGIYYKGVYSIRKYYSNRSIISEAITDFLDDLFIISEQSEVTDRKVLHLFEKLFDIRYYIQRDRIYAKEKRKSYTIEKAASGLQTLSWIYLALKYDLLGEILLIDEPEVSLHPEYIDKLAMLLVELSKTKKIFIATHSDYLLESLNKLILKKDVKIDVWEGKLHGKGAIYKSYQADKDNLIDTSPLADVYMKILKESFEYGV